MTRLRAAGLAGLLTLVVAACSSQPASSPSPSSTPFAGESPSTLPSVSASPSASGSPVAALPSFELPSNAKDLENLLPDEISGQKLTKFSMTGTDFLAQGDSNNKEFTDFLQRVGAQPGDIAVAVGFVVDPAKPDATNGVFAFRVKGADSTKLSDEFKRSMASDTPGTTWSSDTVGGKSVQVAASDTDKTQKTYLYVREDIVFAVMTSDAASAQDALSKLP